MSFDLPVKRDVVLYLTHADTNTDSPGQPLVTVTPPYLKILKGTTSAEVTVQALERGAPRHIADHGERSVGRPARRQRERDGGDRGLTRPRRPAPS